MPQYHFSKVCSGPKSSVISDILALTRKPEIISFAGGLPSPAGFPVETVRQSADWVLATNGPKALQYSSSEGDAQLRAEIARRETERGCPTDPDEVIIVTGSQQALDMVARAFIDEGDKILVESPTYLGALGAFDLCKPTYVTIPVDEGGMNPDLMGEDCRGARFAYVMPTFANPTGITIDLERRKKLVEKAREYDLLLVEDDPYGELYYKEPSPVCLRALAPERVVKLGTFSKVLSPGFRLGYIVAPKPVLEVFLWLKQSMDLHSSTYVQMVAAKTLSTGLFATHLPKVRELYKAQCQAMLDALDEFMPKDPRISWTRPEGGMFIWVNLPESIDATAMLSDCIAKCVAYVPGEAFFAGAPEKNHFRLSFVTVPADRIRQGVKAIAEVLANHL